jgi:hypothetical protein
VAQRRQAPFAALFVEAAHEEMPVSCTAFEGAEGMLGEGSPATLPTLALLPDIVVAPASSPNL